MSYRVAIVALSLIGYVLDIEQLIFRQANGGPCVVVRDNANATGFHVSWSEV